MWIRSQDKKFLGKCKRFNVSKHSSGKYQITNQVLYQAEADDYDILGKYETEERAIEVLHEIHASIQVNIKVFQMPEK